MDATLKINGELADLGDLDFTFDINIKDYQDLKTIKSNKSSSIIIPATPRNKKLLDYLEDTRITKSYASKSAILEVGGLSISGKLKVYEAAILDGASEYRIQVISSSGDWAEDLKDKKLNELDFSGDNHVLNKINVDASEMFETSTDFLTRRNYVYPIINYGMPLTDKKLNIIERYPAINVRSIVYRIFHEQGYSVQGTLGTLLERLHIPYTGGTRSGASDSDLEADLFDVTGNENDTYNIPTGINVPFNFSFNPVSLDTVVLDNGPNFNTTTHIYTARADRAVELKGSLDISLVATTGVTNATATITISILRLRDAVSTIIGGYLISATPSFPSSYNVIQDIDIGYVDLMKGDEITYKITVTGEADSSGSPSSPITCYVVSELLNNSADWYGEGATIDMANILPDTLQTDFLKAIFHIFNATPITDSKRRIVYLNARKNQFTGNTMYFDQDLSKKVSVTQPIRANYTIGFKEDSTDFQSDDNLGAYEYVVANKEDDKSLINGVFSPTLMFSPYILTTYPTYLIPKIWTDDLQSTITETSIYRYPPKWDTKHELRLLYYNGVQTGIWDFMVSGVNYHRTNYPDMVSYNSDVNYNFKDINGVVGLFKTYWKATIDQLNNNQIVNVYFKTNINQLQGFIDAEIDRDARNFIVWNNDKYEVLSIKKVNLTKADSTQFELIKNGIWKGGWGTADTSSYFVDFDGSPFVDFDGSRFIDNN